MKLLLLPGNAVGRLQPRAARVVIVELPLGDGAVRRRLARHLDQPARTEVGPGHLLLARPVALHRLAQRLGDARRFQRRVAVMLAAVTRPGIGHDHARLLLGDAERLREFAAHAERPLRAGPYRELIAFPFRHRRARLQRHVRDVGDGVGRQVGRCRPPALRGLLEILEHAVAVGLRRHRLPLRP